MLLKTNFNIAVHGKLPMLNMVMVTIIFIISGSSVLAQNKLGKIDNYFKEARKTWNVPGMSVAIVQNGEVVLAKGYGTLRAGTSDKVDANTVFAIASNTKAFVSAALATLVDEGQLNWSDPVIKYLPYFRMYDDYVSQNTTIRDLLSHRTGLGTFSGDVIWYKSDLPAEEVVKKVQHVPEAFQFRAGFGYSNLMFITAGEVIRAVTGQAWDTYIKKVIFDPLGMTRTVTSVRTLTGMQNVASPHKPSDEVNQPIPYANWDNMGAAGGILSNANDMASWMILQLNSGLLKNDTLFSPDTQVDMWTPHNNYRLDQGAKSYMPTRHFSGYGLGWGLSDYKGKMLVTHGGGYDGMYSKVTLVPDANLGIVVLTNTMKGISTPISMWAIDQLLGFSDRDWSAEALKQEAAGIKFKKERISKRTSVRQNNTAPSVPLSSFTGEYFDKKYGSIQITVKDNNLQLVFPTASELNATLSHWHFNTYKIEWENTHAWFDFGTIRFETDNNNKVTGLKFDVPNDDIFFHELDMKKIKSN